MHLILAVFGANFDALNAPKADASPPNADGKPQGGDAAVKDLVNTINKGSGADNQSAPPSAQPKYLKPGQGPSVKDQVDKFNANDEKAAEDMRGKNRPTRPKQSDAKPGSENGVDGSDFLDGPTYLDPHNAPDSSSDPSSGCEGCEYEDALRAQQYAHTTADAKHRQDVKSGKQPKSLKSPRRIGF
jgi:hypothetical protein